MVSDRELPCACGAGYDVRYAIDSSTLRAELGCWPQYRDVTAGLIAS